MSTSSTKLLVLDLATEDYTGLWEFSWRAHTRAKENLESIGHEELRKGVSDLVEAGLVALYRGAAFGGEEVILSAEESRLLLADEATWRAPPLGVTHVRAAATDKGAEWYQNNYTPNP